MLNAPICYFPFKLFLYITKIELMKRNNMYWPVDSSLMHMMSSVLQSSSTVSTKQNMRIYVCIMYIYNKIFVVEIKRGRYVKSWKLSFTVLLAILICNFNALPGKNWKLPSHIKEGSRIIFWEKMFWKK